MTNKDNLEIIIKGLLLGLIVFVSTIFAWIISEDLAYLRTYLIPIVAFYIVLGILIRWFISHSAPSVVYWLMIPFAIFTAGAYGLPQAIRAVVVANGITLLLVWFLDFLYLKHIATELNTEINNNRGIIKVNLMSKPQTIDAFIEQIESYCEINNLSVEILTHDIPAKIKMNHVDYEVTLGAFQNKAGSTFTTMEFHNVVTG